MNAAHLLRAAVAVAKTDRSGAFVKLASLLPVLTDVKMTDVPPPDLAALPLTKPLADAFSVAEGFLADRWTVWGRDYVTLALDVRVSHAARFYRAFGSAVSPSAGRAPVRRGCSA